MTLVYGFYILIIMVEQVYDPGLGKERDAFPGEIVPPEQEKTMQRLMRVEAENFRARYDPIVKQLTPQQQDAIAAAEQLLRERKRAEYLEAVKQNPAIIIQSILKQFDPANKSIKNALETLEREIRSLQSSAESQRKSDEIKGTEPDILKYVDAYIRTKGDSCNLAVLVLGPSPNQNDVTAAFEALRRLGLIPTPSINSFQELRSAVEYANNPLESGKLLLVRKRSLATDYYTIKNLFSTRPGLEGIEAEIKYRDLFNNVPESISIKGTQKTYASILDRGNYVPFQQG